MSGNFSAKSSQNSRLKRSSSRHHAFQHDGNIDIKYI